MLIADETTYGGPCTSVADSCTYPNAQCLQEGKCGCEDGLVYEDSTGGCCKNLQYMYQLKII